MPSFGEKLKKEREKRSITLEQISLSTKIGTRMLQALEEDKFTQLPGGIFNKGFVRAYARYVGLDEDQVVSDYLEASGEMPPPPPETQVESAPSLPENRSRKESKPLPWGLFAALLLLVALLLSLWSRRHQPSVAPPAAQSPVSTTVPPPSQLPAAGAPESTPKAEGPSSTKPVPNSPPAAEPGPAPRTAAAGPASEPSGPQPGEFTLVVLAREDSWLNIIADGKTSYSDTLLAGNQRAVHARNQVLVKSGNVGGLDFVFNGKKLLPQGGPGEVKTLTFAADGLQTNTPPATAEP